MIISKLKTLEELIRDGYYPDDAREKAIEELIKKVNILIDITESTCQNCKHWLPSLYGNGDTGSCNLSRQRDHMMSSGCGLKTHKTFGCNQFNKTTI